ncbi:MAG: ABC transporter ATP-binding protein/permease [Treponema sp.]|jgi:ATP-binding cassette subfamily B protein|nr:ABC transporter ATP-binding protein/permease [Treponema sp.]
MTAPSTIVKLPWKKSRPALIAAAAEDRFFPLLFCCAATIGTVLFSFVSPQIIRYTIDSVIGNAPLAAPAFVIRFVDSLGGTPFLRQNLWVCALFTLGVALCSGLLNAVRRYIGIEIGETIAWRLRNTLYGHIQKLPYLWHVRCHTGDIIQRCTSDVDTIRNFLQNQMSELLRIVSVFVVALTMMFSMDVLMSLMALVLIPPIFLFSLLYFKKVDREFARADIAEGNMQACAQENYTGVRVVRAFGRESYEMERFSAKTAAHADIWIRTGKMLGLFWGAGDFMSGLQLIIIVAAGVIRSVQGQLSPGTFLAFYTYCSWMIWPVRQLGRILSELSRTLVSAGRVRDIVAEEPETDPPDALRPALRGEICFENVSFSYTGESEHVAIPVLRNISFALQPGSTLAILGATGSGKSTLVHLIARLYELPPDSGRITIDGIDIRLIARDHLRRHIGLCLQEPFLFSRTIRENIAAGTGSLPIEDIHAAAAVAQVDGSIREFEKSYETVIGERGVTLSGGQKQRLAIARMLAANPPVMIFDDSLSAVDTETDIRIRAALKGRVVKSAVILISHRISSLMQADQILVLKDGEMEELGTHQELLAREGTYRRIFNLQRGAVHSGTQDTPPSPAALPSGVLESGVTGVTGVAGDGRNNVT